MVQPPPPPAPPPRADVQRRLLAAAAELFARRGVDLTEFDDVADAAGCDRDEARANFADKDDLVFALTADAVAARVGEAMELAESAAAAVDLPVAAARLLADWIRHDPQANVLVLEVMTRSTRTRERQRRFAEQRRRQRSYVVAVIQRFADDQGVALTIPAETIAVIVLALSNGLTAEYLVDPEHVPLEALEVVFTSVWAAATGAA